MASAATTTSEIGQDLSGVFGCISLVAWICLLLPQLWANYKAQSADALSMGFLFIWLLGDLTNLAGALVTDLAPSAIAIGSYFIVADVTMIAQCLYYNAINARRRRQRHRLLSSHTEASEDEPLLSRRRSSSGGLPGSHRRSDVRRDSQGMDPLTRIATGEDESSQKGGLLFNALCLVGVYAVGVAAWFVSRKVIGSDGDGADAPVGSEPGASDEVEKPFLILGISLGYASAVCYLCARIPQIIKNWREKSTEGLALLFFLLSLTGNITYGASLISYSQEGAYLMKALPWLLGSLGTMVEDGIIFVQFKLYSPEKEKTTMANGAEVNGDAPPEYEP